MPPKINIVSLTHLSTPGVSGNVSCIFWAAAVAIVLLVMLVLPRAARGDSTLVLKDLGACGNFGKELWRICKEPLRVAAVLGRMRGLDLELSARGRDKARVGSTFLEALVFSFSVAHRAAP